MGVLLLSLFTCGLFCEALQLCITIDAHPAADFYPQEAMEAYPYNYLVEARECVVLVRVVLWAVLSEWVGAWRWIITVETIWENQFSYGDKQIVDIFDMLFIPSMYRRGLAFRVLCMYIRTDLWFNFLCNSTPWIINSYYLPICRASSVCL